MSHTKSELIQSFLPIFYISKLFGCNLYALPNSVTALNDSATGAANVLIGVVHIAINLIIVMPYIKEWESYNSHFNNEYAAKSGYSGLVVIVFIGRISSYAVTVVNCFITVLELTNATITRKILCSLIKFDKDLLNIGMSVDFKHRTMSWSYGLVILLLQIPAICLSFIIARATNRPTVFFIIATYIGFTTNIGCIFSYLATFWYLLINIANRFGSINEYLRQPVKDKRKVRQTNLHSLNDPTIVCNLSDYYRNLVNVISELSKSNALQLICCIVIFFLYSIVTLFMTYLASTGRITDEPPATAIFYTFRLTTHCFLLYKAVSAGSEIRKQRNIALSLLNKATSLEQNKLNLMQLRHFRYQVEHSDMAVSCGMFTIDWTLMYTLGTAITTYMLLFMQFNSISQQSS